MSPRHGPRLLAAALLVAVLAAVLLRDTLGYAVRTEQGTYLTDLDHYVYWTRLVTLGGVQAAYSGTWPETFAVYPPVTLYGYQLVGSLYQALVDPTFDLSRAMQSGWLRAGLKLAAFGWHLAAAAGVYVAVRAGPGRRWAPTAAAVYLANPATLFDVAHWGQPDGAHSLFSVLTVGWLEGGRLLLAAGALALAALAKPQAWSIMPLVGLSAVQRYPIPVLGRAIGVGAGVAGLVVLPFALSGRVAELLRLPGVISSVVPSVSANAHNFWWLALTRRGVEPLATPDSALLVGPISFRAAAAVLVGLQLLLVAGLLWTRRAPLAEAAALSVLGWFVFTTQAHENHLYFAIPLLAVAWASRPTLLVPLAILSGTVLLNMALHDQLLLEAIGLRLDHPRVMALRTMNASINVLLWAGWMAAAVRRRVLSGREAETYTVGTPQRAEVAQW